MNKTTVIDKTEMVTFRYWPVNCAVMDFEVFEIFTISSDGLEVDYRKKNAVSYEPVDDLDQAEMLFSGGIKFDGCINVIFADQKNCMPHFCENPARRFSTIFNRLYSFAAELMPEHKKYLLGAS